MKMTLKMILVPALLLAVLASTPALAQKDDSSALPVQSSEAFCDELITDLKAQMQKEADANCKTVQTSVRCLDRTTKQPMYATLLFQPDNTVCQTASEITETAPADKEEKTEARAANVNARAGNAAARSQSFEYSVMQSRCPKGETSYEVYIPGNEASCNTNAYKVQWEVDGKKAGTSTSLQCVSGKNVKVSVTRTATGATKTKTIKAAAGKSAIMKAKPKD